MRGTVIAMTSLTMSPFHILFALFIAVPLLEIWLLIQVGGVIGAGWTVFFVVFTAALGAVLVRAQGLSTLRRIQAMLERGQMPAVEMMEGLVLFVCGALLLTPGFFTDTIGFLLLVPVLRRRLITWVLNRGLVAHWQGQGRPRQRTGSRGSRTLEGEWRREDD